MNEAPPSSNRPTDFVLITIDALRADALSIYGHPEETAPTITSWAEEAVLFRHAFAHVSETQLSVPTLLQGRFPVGPTFELIEEGQGLAEKLQALGYRTAAFLGNAWLSPERGYKRGFDTFSSVDYFYPPEGDHSRTRVDGRVLVNRAIAFLKKSKSPAFVWLHLMDVHAPYRPPEGFRGRFGGLEGLAQSFNGPLPPSFNEGDLALVKARYKEGILYTDMILEPLLRLLESPERRARTLTVLTSDHGEELGEHGGLGHGTSLYLEQLRVPLMMKFPAASFGGMRVARGVSLSDVAPTLLGWAARGQKGAMVKPARVALNLDIASSRLARSAAATEKASSNPGHADSVFRGRDLTLELASRVRSGRREPGSGSPTERSTAHERNPKAMSATSREPSEAREVGAERTIPLYVESIFSRKSIHGAIRGPFHLLWNNGEQGGELYRWTDDPLERHNRTGEKPETVEALRNAAAGVLEFPAGRVMAPPLSAGRREKLDALGYVGRP